MWLIYFLNSLAFSILNPLVPWEASLLEMVESGHQKNRVYHNM